MQRLAALDGLRGIAALMVFIHHVQLPGIFPATLGMDAGVLIFFSLSGYLLYMPFVVAREDGRSIDLTAYAIRRLLRIAPAYLLAAFAIAAWRYPGLLGDPLGLASTLRTPIVVVWTLQLEVAFYVLLPLFATAVSRFGSPNRVRILLAAAAGSVAFSVVTMILSLVVFGFVPGEAVSTIASYLWAFVPGMIVAELQRRGRFDRTLAWPVAAAGGVLVAISVAVDLPAFLDLSAALGAGALIAFVVSRPTIGARFDRIWIVAGALSYSFYLWHESIIDAVDRPVPSWSGAALAAVLTIAVSAVVYVVVERPAVRLAHRLRPRTHVRVRPRALVEPLVEPLPGPSAGA